MTKRKFRAAAGKPLAVVTVVLIVILMLAPVRERRTTTRCCIGFTRLLATKMDLLLWAS